MNMSTYWAYQEFERARRIEKEIGSLVYNMAFETMRRAYEENGKKPIHFKTVYCEDRDGEYLGEFTTLDLRLGFHLSGDRDGDGYLEDHTKICHKDLEELLKAIMSALG